MAGILYIISAPSGSGKSTLVNELRTIVPSLEFSISYTTRPPRGSETNGREYFFIDRAEFEVMIARGEFLEYAEVFGNYYGTARRFLKEAEVKGKDLLLDIDVQGARQVRERLPEAVSIFVMPPDRETLERRLRSRSQTEGMRQEEVIRRRLENARLEIENWQDYGYILVNDQLERAVDELRSIVLWARLDRAGAGGSKEARSLLPAVERCRRSNSDLRVKPVLDSFRIS
jgi:guanylate kinase